jgi:hypothetical protein
LAFTTSKLGESALENGLEFLPDPVYCFTDALFLVRRHLSHASQDGRQFAFLPEEFGARRAKCQLGIQTGKGGPKSVLNAFKLRQHGDRARRHERATST